MSWIATWNGLCGIIELIPAGQRLVALIVLVVAWVIVKLGMAIIEHCQK